MATRNLTSLFENLRAGVHRPSHGDDTHIDFDLPPQWVDIVEAVQSDIETVKDKFKLLAKLYAARLKVSFGDDEKSKEAEINAATKQITTLIKSSEHGLKRIATSGYDDAATLSQQERTIRLNVMRALGVELQSLSKRFRVMQKEYMGRLRGQEEMDANFFQTSNARASNLDDALDRGLNDEEMQKLEEMDKSASEREREIIHIAQNINELSTIFKELSMLVIEQGTILDRIDYNIESTLTHVQKGVVELKAADEYSKKSRTMKCIFCLLVLVIILTFILIIKEGWLSDDNTDSKK